MEENKEISSKETLDDVEQMSDEQYYNNLVEGYSAMGDELTVDQEIEMRLNEYINGIKLESTKFRDALEEIKREVSNKKKHTATDLKIYSIVSQALNTSINKQVNEAGHVVKVDAMENLKALEEGLNTNKGFTEGQIRQLIDDYQALVKELAKIKTYILSEF